MRSSLRLLAALALCVLSLPAQSAPPEPLNLPANLQPLYQSALKGNVDAQLDLALRYSTGSIEVRRNLALSAKWLRKAADQGSIRAMLTLADFCRDSRFGPPNPAEAFRWVQLAVQKSDASPDKADPSAYLHLGNAYLDGEGVAKNPAEGLKAVQKAAALGHAPALTSLAERYEAGNGVAQDYAEACKWYVLADLMGARVKPRLDLVIARLQPADAAKAQRGAEQYVREHPAVKNQMTAGADGSLDAANAERLKKPGMPDMPAANSPSVPDKARGTLFGVPISN